MYATGGKRCSAINRARAPQVGSDFRSLMTTDARGVPPRNRADGSVECASRSATSSADRGVAKRSAAVAIPRRHTDVMRNILFFANDQTLTSHVLDTACDCAATVPTFRLSFAPGPGVWETIA